MKSATKLQHHLSQHWSTTQLQHCRLQYRFHPISNCNTTSSTFSISKPLYYSSIDRAPNNHFYSVYCPPYYPKIVPIKKNYELAAELSQWCRREWTIDNLHMNIYNICSRIGCNVKLYSTVVRCRYLLNSFIIYKHK